MSDSMVLGVYFGVAMAICYWVGKFVGRRSAEKFSKTVRRVDRLEHEQFMHEANFGEIFSRLHALDKVE